MFYAQYILAKNGPLALVWQAAHWDLKNKKLVNETNIEDKVQQIVGPQVPIALRTSGHLLVGVVKIYSKKAFYLVNDCSDALSKIKVAFKPTAVEMDEASTVGQVHHLTNVHWDFDSAFDLMHDEVIFDLNQQPAGKNLVGRLDQITIDDQVEMDISTMELDGSEPEPTEITDLEVELPRDAQTADDTFVLRPEELNVSVASASGRKKLGVSDIQQNLTIESFSLDQDGDTEALGEAFDPSAMDLEALALEGQMATPAPQPPTPAADVEEPRGNAGEEAVATDITTDEPIAQGDDDGGMVAESGDVQPEGVDDVTSKLELETVEEAKEVEEDLPVPMVDNMVDDIDLMEMPMASNIPAKTRHTRKKTKVALDSVTAMSREDIKSQLASTADLLADTKAGATSSALGKFLGDGCSTADLLARPTILGSTQPLAHLITRNMVTTERLPLPVLTEQLITHEGHELSATNITLDEISLDAPSSLVATEPSLADSTLAFSAKRAADEPLESSTKRQRHDSLEEPEALPVEVQPDSEPSMAQPVTEASIAQPDNEPSPPATPSTPLLEMDAESAANGIDPTLSPAFELELLQDEEEKEDSEPEEAEHFSELKSKRTIKMLKSFKAMFQERDELSFNSLVKGQNRRTAAACLFEVLALKTRGLIEVQQNKPYDDIYVTQGGSFEATSSSLFASRPG